MFLSDFLNLLEEAQLDEWRLTRLRAIMLDVNASKESLILVFNQNRALIDQAISKLPSLLQRALQPMNEALFQYCKNVTHPQYHERVLKRYVAKGNFIGVATGIELGVNINTRAGYLSVSSDLNWMLKFSSASKSSLFWMGHAHRCTPLILASSLGHLNLVRYLVIQGADLNAETKYGLTALDWATKSNHQPVVDYLLQQGALRHVTSDPEMKIFSSVNFSY